MSNQRPITVKFFASLRERVGRAELQVPAREAMTAADLWAEVGTGAALNDDGVLVAVNLDYVEPDHRLRAGDEVAFFPPVTGG